MKMIPAIYTSEGNLVKGAVNGFLQPVVTIPLSHETHTPSVCLVRQGDRVREGDIIAVPASNASSRYGAKLHASVPGIVEDIVSCISPNGREEDAVKIRLSGRFSYLGKKRFSENWSSENRGCGRHQYFRYDRTRIPRVSNRRSRTARATRPCRTSLR